MIRNSCVKMSQLMMTKEFMNDRCMWPNELATRMAISSSRMKHMLCEAQISWNIFGRIMFSSLNCSKDYEYVNNLLSIRIYVVKILMS